MNWSMWRVREGVSEWNVAIVQGTWLRVGSLYLGHVIRKRFKIHQNLQVKNIWHTQKLACHTQSLENWTGLSRFCQRIRLCIAHLLAPLFCVTGINLTCGNRGLSSLLKSQHFTSSCLKALGVSFLA